MSDVPVRRFERTASGTGIDRMLEEMGYGVRANGATFRVYKTGTSQKPKTMKARELLWLLDEERIRRGLQPIVKAHGEAR